MSPTTGLEPDQALFAMVDALDEHLEIMSAETHAAYAVLHHAVAAFEAGADDLIISQANRVRFMLIGKPEAFDPREEAIARFLLAAADAAIKLAGYSSTQPEPTEVLGVVKQRWAALESVMEAHVKQADQPSARLPGTYLVAFEDENDHTPVATVEVVLDRPVEESQFYALAFEQLDKPDRDRAQVRDIRKTTVKQAAEAAKEALAFDDQRAWQLTSKVVDLYESDGPGPITSVEQAEREMARLVGPGKRVPVRMDPSMPYGNAHVAWTWDHEPVEMTLGNGGASFIVFLHEVAHLVAGYQGAEKHSEAWAREFARKMRETGLGRAAKLWEVLWTGPDTLDFFYGTHEQLRPGGTITATGDEYADYGFVHQTTRGALDDAVESWHHEWYEGIEDKVYLYRVKPLSDDIELVHRPGRMGGDEAHCPAGWVIAAVMGSKAATASKKTASRIRYEVTERSQGFSDHGVLVYAYDGDQQIGRLEANYRWGYEDEQVDTWSVWHIVVDEDYRRQHIGRGMVKALRDEFPNHLIIWSGFVSIEGEDFAHSLDPEFNRVGNRGVTYEVEERDPPSDPVNFLQAQHRAEVRARVGGEEVGTLKCRYRLHEGRDAWKVLDIYVEPGHRRQGIARGMVEALHERYPDHLILHGLFTGPEGEDFAESMPVDWNRVVSKTASALPRNLYWRFHDPERPFTEEEAHSTPVNDSMNLHRRQTGFSALDDPWVLYTYAVRLGWLFTNWVDNDEVIGFDGRIVGFGVDGEALVMPEGEPVYRKPVEQFYRDLANTPLPDPTTHPPHGSLTGSEGVWNPWYELAESKRNNPQIVRNEADRELVRRLEAGDIEMFLPHVDQRTRDLALGKEALAERLDWRVVDPRPEHQTVEAVYLGLRFRLQGQDSYMKDDGSKWGPSKYGGWKLDILEPGDDVQLGIPHNHRFDDEAHYERFFGQEVRSRFDTLEEGKSYVEEWIIGRGMVDQMVPRDLFPQGSTRYHLTLARHVPSILSQGLEPRSQVGTGTSVFSELRKVTSILWDLKDEDWAAYQNEPIALLELDVSGLPRSTVKHLSGEERVNTTIEPSRISVLVPDIPWYLTESRFSSWSMSESEALALLRGDLAATRKAWVGAPEELDELMSQASKTGAVDLRECPTTDRPWGKCIHPTHRPDPVNPEMVRLLDIATEGRPEAETGGNRETYNQLARDEWDMALDQALYIWRRSFINSSNMRKFLEGGKAAMAPGANDLTTRFYAVVLWEAVKRGTIPTDSWRIEMGSWEPGRVMDWKLKAVAKERHEAEQFRKTLITERAGVSLLHVPAGVPGVVYPDGREGLVSGRFRVASVEPHERGFDVVELEYVGETRMMAKRAARGDDPQSLVREGPVTLYRGMVLRDLPEDLERHLLSTEDHDRESWKDRGQRLVEYLRSRPQGLGTHWTTDRQVALSLGLAHAGGMAVLLEAQWDGSSGLAERQYGHGGESEVTLEPYAPLEVTGAYLVTGSGREEPMLTKSATYQHPVGVMEDAHTKDGTEGKSFTTLKAVAEFLRETLWSAGSVREVLVADKPDKISGDLIGDRTGVIVVTEAPQFFSSGGVGADARAFVSPVPQSPPIDYVLYLPRLPVSEMVLLHEAAHIINGLQGGQFGHEQDWAKLYISLLDGSWDPDLQGLANLVRFATGLGTTAAVDPDLKVMYHVSAGHNRESIQQHGLRLPEGFWDFETRSHTGRYIWLFADRETAERWLPKSWGGSRGFNDLWEVDVSGYEVQPDPHPGWEGVQAYVVTESIGPERVRLVKTVAKEAAKNVTVYRGMKVKVPGQPEDYDSLDQWVQAVTQAMTSYHPSWKGQLGRSWSTSREVAVRFSAESRHTTDAPVRASASYTYVPVVVEGQVSSSDEDWLRDTADYGGGFEWEREFHLRDGAEVQVTRMSVALPDDLDSYRVFGPSDEGREWRETTWHDVPVNRTFTAASDVTYRYIHPNEGAYPSHVVAAIKDGQVIGVMSWFKGLRASLAVVWVAKEHRRQGIATGMWNEALRVEPELRHSDMRSPAGDNWAREVGGPGLDQPRQRITNTEAEGDGQSIARSIQRYLDQEREAVRGDGDGFVYTTDGERFWGVHGAAGLLVRHIDEDGTTWFFLQKRSGAVEEGGTWSIPGGAIDSHETPTQAALREFAEETELPTHGLGIVGTYVSQPVPEWSYTTVVAETPDALDTPDLVGWEQEDSGWFTLDEMRSMNLHPGLRDSLNDVARFAKTAVAQQRVFRGMTFDSLTDWERFEEAYLRGDYRTCASILVDTAERAETWRTGYVPDAFGVHWTSSFRTAVQFGNGLTTYYNGLYPNVGVVFEGLVDEEDLAEDASEYGMQEGEHEVPLRPGASVTITAVHMLSPRSRVPEPAEDDNYSWSVYRADYALMARREPSPSVVTDGKIETVEIRREVTAKLDREAAKVMYRGLRLAVPTEDYVAFLEDPSSQASGDRFIRPHLRDGDSRAWWSPFETIAQDYAGGVVVEGDTTHIGVVLRAEAHAEDIEFIETAPMHPEGMYETTGPVRVFGYRVAVPRQVPDSIEGLRLGPAPEQVSWAGEFWWGHTAGVEDYGGGHRPPSDGPPLHDLLAPSPEGGKLYPDDVYTHPHYYTFGEHAAEATRIIQRVRGEPDATVTIYRSIPPTEDATINTGDWVSITEGYARHHGFDRGWDEWVEHPVSDEYPMGGVWERREGDWPVVAAEVPAHTVRNGGNDLIEWGYWGPPLRGRKLASLSSLDQAPVPT